MQVVCVDFGSTFTKLLVVDTRHWAGVGVIVCRNDHHTDVIDGLDNAKVGVREVVPDVDDLPSHACSSAGGGLAPRSCWL